MSRMDLPHAVPADMDPCAPFVAHLDAWVDRELGRAESARIESHLEACASCRTQVAQREALAAALKAWDQRQAQAVRTPDVRLRRSVLGQVEAMARLRRRDRRWSRASALALAACVLLALGAGLWLGVTHQVPMEDRSDVVRAPVEAVPVDLPAVAVDLPEGRVMPLGPVAALDLPALEPVEGVHVPLTLRPLERLALAEVMVESARQAFEARAGEASVLVLLPGEETPRFMTVSAWRASRNLPLGALLGVSAAVSVPPVAEPVRETTPEAQPLASTGRTAADLLRAEVGAEGLDMDRLALLEQVHARTATAGAGSLRYLHRPKAGGLTSTNGTRGRLNVDDPVAAFDAGRLRFEEAREDDVSVVALVKGTRRPLFLPAGQLLRGGVVDRVVSRPVWVPASPSGEARHEIPCRAVGTAVGGDALPSVRLTPWIVGPALRGLLTTATDDDAWMAACLAQWQAWSGRLGQGEPVAWSLGDRLDSAFASQLLGFSLQRAHPFVQDARLVGFARVDAQGRVQAFDLAPLEGRARTLLLARLYVGYEFERMAHRNGLTLPTSSLSWPALMKQLVASPEAMQAPGGAADDSGTRTSRAVLPTPALHVQAVERVGRSVHLAATPR